MKNEKTFILAGILLEFSVITFFCVSYPSITREFPQYDKENHMYVPKSELQRQYEMRYDENFPNYVYIIFIRPLFLDFAVFSVVFYMLWANIDIPIYKDLVYKIKNRKNELYGK